MKKDPSVLFSKDLAFLLQVLKQYGSLKEPVKPAAADSGHDHAHAHSHSHSCNHDSHKETPEPEHDDDDDIDEPEDSDPEGLQPDPEPYLSIPTGGEDWDGSANAKEQANDAKAAGNYDLAITKFTEAMAKGQVSALTLATRAECLLKMKKPCAAISDCTAALTINPDSAKALRCRGKAYRFLGKWDEANLDLASAQRIDYDPELQDLQKLVSNKVAGLEAKRTANRLRQEKKQREKLLARKAEVERAREEARQQAEQEKNDSFGGGMGGAMPGGMPGMGGGGMPGGMEAMLKQMLMSDPELAKGMQNPKIMRAFSAMMGGGGGGAADAMKDPEVMAFMNKVQTKLGPMMGGMGGMGGGRATPSSSSSYMPAEDDLDDMPDLEEVD